jgi:hypothetical protein
LDAYVPGDILVPGDQDVAIVKLGEAGGTAGACAVGGVVCRDVPLNELSVGAIEVEPNLDAAVYRAVAICDHIAAVREPQNIGSPLSAGFVRVRLEFVFDDLEIVGDDGRGHGSFPLCRVSTMPSS